MSTQSENEAPDRWHFRALVTAAGGVLFATMLAALLVTLQAWRVPPLRALEQAGIDAGMWAYANVGGLGEPAARAGAAPLRYAFVDVDRAACEAFLDGAPASACATDNPARSALVIDLVRALRSAGAKVVVVDVAPPAAQAERERAAWLAALAAPNGPWVIAPVFARPSDECGDGLSLRGERAHDITPAHAVGRLRLASVATLLDAELGDGVLRHYPMASRLLVDGQAPRWIPTVPMLAAALARGADAAEIDARWYAPPVPAAASAALDCGASRPAQPALQPIPADNRFDAGATAGTPAVVRFFFSLPGLSLQDEAHRRRAEQRHLSVYERYEASRLVEPSCNHRLDAQALPQPGCFGVRPALFEGKVVVIGASSATALDIVQTPVGPMSGAEVLVNATRAFAEFPAITLPSGWTLWFKKLGGMAVPALLALITWLLIHGAWDALGARQAALQQRGRSSAARWTGALRIPAVVLLFVAGFVAAGWLELRDMVHELSQAHSHAEPVDMLLPVVAMGLEGYAEAAKWADRVIEHRVEPAVDWVYRRLGLRRHRGAKKEHRP
ncbi:MAG: CHASE2 domain-containing protein [Rhizobacter sp.]